MYRTSKEESEILNQVRAGTPMGDFLRRYWWPVGFSAHLKLKPTYVKVLGEDLVLFRDRSDKVSLVGALCPHRRANLCLGTIAPNGIRCKYHGWLIDGEGSVLDTPGDPDSPWKKDLKHPAYQTEELGGLIFAYMGPQPAPLLPRYDFLVGEGQSYLTIQGFQDCHWLQCVENGLDPVHPSFTHGGAWPDIASTEPDLGFHETELGLVYKALRTTKEKNVHNYREHHLMMPGISCGGSGGRYLKGKQTGTPVSAARWSVPIDETHTILFRVRFKPGDNAAKFEGDPFTQRWRPSVSEPFILPFKEYRTDNNNPELGYDVPPLHFIEDGMVIDSIGPVADRENETLSPVIDEGIIMLRKMYLREIKRMQDGQDPKGIIRDPSKNKLITVTAYERWVSDEERKQLETADA
jgi:5,5'-dehydrodivanillate O-demethylase